MIMGDTHPNILHSLGLSKTESVIYLDLTRTPESSIVDVAKRTNLHRPNVYDSIRRLKEKGLIVEVIKKGKKLFSVSKPERLSLYIDQMKDEVKKFIDDLNKISGTNKEKESVSLEEGMVSLKSEMLNFLKSKKDTIYVLGTHGTSLLDSKFLNKFHKARVQKKIQLKIIFSKKEEKQMKKINAIPYTESRYLNYGNNNLTTVVTGETVYHLLNKNGVPVIIKIRHSDIAKEQKLHFDNAWNKARVV